MTETPSGLINGSNTIYTLAYEPIPATLVLWRNGVAQQILVDFTLSASTVTFLTAPQSGDWLFALYSSLGLTGDSYLNPTTIGDIAQWCVTKMMNRTDLLDLAYEFGKDVYLHICGRVPFEELQVTSAELAFTSGTAAYSLANLVPAVSGIMSVRASYVTSTRRLRRSHVRLYDNLSSVTNGRPHSYARWGNSIEVNPPPDSSSYTYRIRYWCRPPIQTELAQTQLITPPEWDELFKWETYYRLLHATGQEEKAMSLMVPTQLPSYPGARRKTRSHGDVGIIPRLWNDLLRTYSEREGIDEDFSINPVMRAYTATKAG